MRTIIRTDYSKTGSPYTVAATRVSTAVEMHKLTLKLADEQETGGCYGDLLEEMREWGAENKVFLNFIYDKFIGKEEVIFELRIYLDKRGDFDEGSELFSEEIFGYIFKKLKAHFEWDWICADADLGFKIKELIK